MLAAQTAPAAAALPAAARILLPIVLVGCGLAISAVGVLGMRGRLPRNRWAGVRTPATMRSDEAFVLANRVAGAPLLAAGAVALVAGALLGLMPSATSALIVLVVGLVGSLGLALVGGGLGHRAAAALPEPADSCESGGGCAGCTALCPLR